MSAMDFRKRLGEALDRAAAGERIVIERDRQPLAILVPYSLEATTEESEEERALRVDAAFSALRIFAKRMAAKYPGGPDAATAVRMDRDGGHSVDRA